MVFKLPYGTYFQSDADVSHKSEVGYVGDFGWYLTITAEFLGAAGYMSKTLGFIAGTSWLALYPGDCMVKLVEQIQNVK